LLDSFARELFHSRYANITARKHIRSAEHFIHVSTANRIQLPQWDRHALEAFFRHFRRRSCLYGHAGPENQLTGARLFLKHLRACGVINGPLVHFASEPALLVAFRRWMHEQRGTCDATLDNYDRAIRDLLKSLGENPQRFDARGIRQCFLNYSAGKGPVPVKHGATALRMFVRFLTAEGQCSPGLEAAVPLVPHWRLSSLPRYLQAEEVERIVASCDQSTEAGSRDRAILLLLARLGLRAGDIVQLRLDDINWKSAWVHVCGKSRRQTRLPLSQEVGDALVAYLQKDRPQTDSDRVFVCCRAPFRPFASHHAVSAIVDQAMRRAGVTPPGRGAAHLLRHSVATSLLRQGVSLQDIATTLRHRSIRTTQIYAKVDVSMLERIAQPWPEVQPC
jgi:site-specific recombinase XerD